MIWAAIWAGRRQPNDRTSSRRAVDNARRPQDGAGAGAPPIVGCPGRLRHMDDDLLNLDVDTSDLRRVFGMLMAYVLLPDSNHTSAREFDELDLAGRVHTLAAARALWHLMGAASERDDRLENVVTQSRHVADEDVAMLPDALRLARALDDERKATGGEAISAHLVAEIAAEGTRDLGALAYCLRGTRVALHTTAAARGTSVEELLAATGQHLAEA